MEIESSKEATEEGLQVNVHPVRLNDDVCLAMLIAVAISALFLNFSKTIFF
jgi:hypothetical protein